MEKYIMKSDIPIRINLIGFISLNNHIKREKEFISNLINNNMELKFMLKLDKPTKIFYYNKDKIIEILNKEDEIITIDDLIKNDFESNFYLDSLITEDSFIINYQFSLNYIKTFNNYKKEENNIIFNIIKYKIIIDQINNYNNCDWENGDEEDDFVSKLKQESIDYIKNHINEIKDIIAYLKEEDIMEMNTVEIYNKIIINLIKTDKISDYDYSIGIINQLELESIDMPFMENENLFQEIIETLDIKNNYIEKYIIKIPENIKDKNIVNFHYILLKYILKNPIYIYHIPLLFEAHKKIIEFIKAKSFISLSFENNIWKERTEFVIKTLSGLDYYFMLYKSCKSDIINKLNNQESVAKYIGNNENDVFFFEGTETIVKQKDESKINAIKSEILRNSQISFVIKNEMNSIIEIDKIFYGNNNKITYDEMLALCNNSNNSELNEQFYCFLYILKNFCSEIKNLKHKLDVKFRMEFQLKPEENNIFLLCFVLEHQNNNYQRIAETKDILNKTFSELKGFQNSDTSNNFDQNNISNIFIDSLISDSKSTMYSSHCESSGSGIWGESDTKLIFRGNFDEITKSLHKDSEQDNEIENNYQILTYEREIYQHKDSVKFLLNVKKVYYLSCGDDKTIVLYNNELNPVTKINNLDNTLYHISEKETEDPNMIELIACYLKYIYLIEIDLKNHYKYTSKKYEIPKTKVLCCIPIVDNYVLFGINTSMNVKDLFNDSLEQKKMNRLSNDSYKTGCKINNNYIAASSNKLIPGGNNEVCFFNLTKNRLVAKIENYSPIIYENSLKLIELSSDNKKLLCGCKKYNAKDKTGILVIDVSSFEEEDMDEINNEMIETDDFEPNCFCQIYNENGRPTNYFLAGGFASDKHIGIVKLYKFKDENSLEIQYLQDIEYYDKFEMPVNSITQCKDSGKIIITTVDGGVHLFGPPNINIYLNLIKG